MKLLFIDFITRCNVRCSRRSAFVACVAAAITVPALAQTLTLEEARHQVDTRVNYDRLLPVLEEMAKANPRDADVEFQTARVAYALGHLGSAEQHAKSALALGSSSERHLLLARVLAAEISRASIFQKLSLARKAKVEFTAAVTEDPKSISARLGLMDFFADAPAIAGGDHAQAQRQAEEIAQLDPGEGHFARGDLYMSASDYANAEKEYQAAQALAASSAKPLIKLAVLRLAQNRLEEADREFQHALAADPDVLLPNYYLGRYRLVRDEQLPQAERYFQAYLARWPEDGDPTMGEAHWRLGQVYEKEGHIDLATAKWRDALRLQPELKEAQESLRRYR